MTKEEILSYIKETYGIDYDCPWEKYPENCVFRHKRDGKWFALVFPVSGDKLGFDSNDPVNIVNLKCEPMLITTLTEMPGFRPAYHMNKTHWITAILDGAMPSAPDDELKNLIEMSFNLTL